MNPSPNFVFSNLDASVVEFTLILVGDDGASMRASGSAVFIAPRLALTARHVVEDLWLSFSGESKPPVGTDEVVGAFRVLALQFLAPDDLAVWTIEKVWGCSHSDLSVLALTPLSVNALSYKFDRQLALRATPPEVGSTVAAFGFAGSSVEVISREPNLRLTWGLNPASTQGTVLNVFDSARDRVLLNFPCFEINARFEGGMSGGPVFNDRGELCGIVCASVTAQDGVSHIAYSATLWPVFGSLIDFAAPNLVVNGPYNIADLGRVGYVHLRGWEEVAPRIRTTRDELGRERLMLV